MTIIYALFDPRQPDLIRYVGMTSMSLRERMNQHVGHSKKGRSYKAAWIRKLAREGVRPEIRVLEEVNSENWGERERFWISSLSSKHRLTNLTAGGEGMPNPSNEIRAKLSAAHKGRKASAETVAILKEKNGPRARRLAAEKIGVRRPEHSAAMKRLWAEGRIVRRLSRRTFTDEQRRLHSEILKARVTPEFRLKMSQIKRRRDMERRGS